MYCISKSANLYKSADNNKFVIYKVDVICPINVKC